MVAPCTLLTLLSSHAGLAYSHGGLLLDNGSICAPQRGYFPISPIRVLFYLSETV